MKSVYKLLFTLLPGLISASSFSQTYFCTETAVKPADTRPNFIGAELPTDKKYFFKTAEGLDSVLLASYSIYGHGINRTFILDPVNRDERAKYCGFTKSPYFKGTLSEGKMQEGELYFEVAAYATTHLFKGSFSNNRANGLGIYTITSTQIGITPISCKAYFDNGMISDRALLKTDYDSTGTPTLYYCGDIKLVDGNSLIMHGTGSFFRTDFVKPYHNFYKPILNKGYGLGVSDAYYEGQIIDNVRTGFGLYNIYQYDLKKTSNFKLGLIAADYPVYQFSELPINTSTPNSVKSDVKDLFRLLPQISEAKQASFMYNGRRYTGTQYNKKPYGFGIMADPDGFYEIGFWKDGTRINTLTLLKNLLPDSALLTAHKVENKISRVVQKYNRKKNEYYNEKEISTGDIVYCGKLNNEGKIEGWGFRFGGYRTEVGYFLPTALETNIKKEMPEAATIFKTCYTLNYGDGGGSGYGVEWAKRRFFTVNGVYAEQTVPYGGIYLAQRDTNTIALCEYRDRRNYEVTGWEKYTAEQTAKNKKTEEEKKKAFDALFLYISSPSNAEIQSSVGNFYLDRSGTQLYKILKVDVYTKKIQAELRPVNSFNSSYITLSVADLFSNGNFRKIQKYVTCRSCDGKGTNTSTYSYTADYEYTYGVKIKTTTSKTTVCGCGCGLEPEQFGAKRDW